MNQIPSVHHLLRYLLLFFFLHKGFIQTTRMINMYIFYVKKIEFHTKKYIQGFI